MGYTITFDALKRKAIRLLAQDAATAYRKALTDGSGGIAAIKFAKLDMGERDELTAFADQCAFNDEIAAAAKRHDPLGLTLLRARENDIRVVDKCDVRNVGKLLARFPNLVPKRYRGVPCVAYEDDARDSAWVIAFE